jgi:hypothetical protein
MFHRRDVRLSDELRPIVEQRLRQWHSLTRDERARLEQLTARILRKRWEPANGCALTDDMRVTVAGHAALLHLGLDDEPFTHVIATVVDRQSSE